MILNTNQIRAVTLGAARIEEENDGIHFYRFTKEQEEFYRKKEKGHHLTFDTSGIRFRFRTDSSSLGVKFSHTPGGSRTYFSLDVFVNGVFFDDLKNFEEIDLPRKYTVAELPCGTFEKEFSLGEGEKEVQIYLPWNSRSVLHELSLDDGALLLPVKPEKKILFFGDSITQGYDALHPSRRYTAQLADYLGFEEVNKAIGGEYFQPTLSSLKDDFEPTVISVAYGTNDWRHRTTDELEESIRGFFQNLRKTYPSVPIVAIAPIWRSICHRNYDCCPFRELPALIQKATEGIENLTLVDAFDFVPHYSDYFADLTLHPNGAGYDRYFEGLKPYFEIYR